MARKNHQKKSSFLSKIRWKSLVVVSSIILIIVLPIVLLSINWNNMSILYASGSSAVFPLMKELSYAYQNHRGENNPSIDVSVESTGSGAGLEKVLNQTTNFGNISYSPSISLVKEKYQQWKSLQIKTISWGIDGISLVYRGDFNLDINSKNIDDIFIAFSGVRQLKYSDLGVSNSNLTVLPYARTGGANKSGTTEAFLKNSGFSLNNNDPDLKQALDAIKNGDYKNNYVQTTKESQQETWHQMSISPQPGQIAYLSTGFVLQNRQDILKAGYKIATYNKHSLTKENIQNGNYNWRRILNSLVSVKNASDDLKEWVDWILLTNYNQSYISDVYNNIGIVQLSQEQITKDMMSKDGNFWVSDIELHDPYKINDSSFNYGVRL